jgi:hypothetical protein
VRRCAPILEFPVPLDVDALTALSDLAAIAESGVDARSLDDVVVPAWVSAPYDEHLTQPLLRPEAPELAAPPAPLGLPLTEPRFAVPAPGLAVLVDGRPEPEPLHLDRLPLDPDAPAAPEWPQHLRAGWLAALGAVSTLAVRAGAATAHHAARLREADVVGRAGVAVRELRALARDVAADLRDTGPRLGRLAAATVGTALLAAVLTPVLAPERPDGLSALSVLASASPLSFDAEPGSLPASAAPASPRSAGPAPADASEAAPVPAGSGTDAGDAEPATPAEAGSEAGPLDVLRAGLPFGQDSAAAPQPRAVAAGAAATALPARSGTGRRLVIGSERAWAVAADGSVVRTWPLVRGTCPSPGTYRVRQGPARVDGVRAALWAARGDGRSRIVHGASAPCAAAAPGDARWLREWTTRGMVVVIRG